MGRIIEKVVQNLPLKGFSWDKTPVNGSKMLVLGQKCSSWDKKTAVGAKRPSLNKYGCFELKGHCWGFSWVKDGSSNVLSQKIQGLKNTALKKAVPFYKD